MFLGGSAEVCAFVTRDLLEPLVHLADSSGVFAQLNHKSEADVAKDIVFIVGMGDALSVDDGAQEPLICDNECIDSDEDVENSRVIRLGEGIGTSEN